MFGLKLFELTGHCWLKRSFVRIMLEPFFWVGSESSFIHTGNNCLKFYFIYISFLQVSVAGTSLGCKQVVIYGTGTVFLSIIIISVPVQGSEGTV